MTLKIHRDCPYIEDVATLKADVSALKQTTSRIETKIDVFITKSDERYASKESVDFIRKIVFGTLSAFLLAALAFAIKQIYGW